MKNGAFFLYMEVREVCGEMRGRKSVFGEIEGCWCCCFVTVAAAVYLLLLLLYICYCCCPFAFAAAKGKRGEFWGVWMKREGIVK